MKAKVLKPSWARQLNLFPENGNHPAAPCAHVLKFKPRTEVMAIRMPQELADWIETEAAQRYMTRSHLLLRIVSQWALDQVEKLDLHGKQSEAA